MGSRIYRTVRYVMRGAVNDVVVCQDIASDNPVFYTLIIIKDREAVKKMFSILEQSERKDMSEPEFVIDCFAHNELMIYVFPYRTEREFKAFAGGQLHTAEDREAVCTGLVMLALSTPLPFPLLYRVLEERQLHISQDNTLYFSYCFDLDEVSAETGESDCAYACVEIILDILSSVDRRGRLKSARLLRRKLERGAYQSIASIYRDIKVTVMPQNKISLKRRLGGLWNDWRDRLFRFLLVLCVITFVLALTALISHLVFKDVFLFRVFERCFEVIGTERLAP